MTEQKCVTCRICSDHFISGSPANLEDTTNPDWIPNVNMGYEHHKTHSDSQRMKRHHRAIKRLKIEGAVSCVTSENMNIIQDDLQNEQLPEEMLIGKTTTKYSSISSQTDLTAEDITNMEKEISLSNFEKSELRCKISHLTLSEEAFKDKPEMIQFYTGLPNLQIFLVLLTEISTFINITPTSVLNKFQQLLLTLMKLRLNLKYLDLGYRFNVSSQTTSRIFNRTLHILSIRLAPMILWPDREMLKKTMPTSFIAAFGKSVTIIIDCFEIFIERPSNPMAKCQTWSSYKHHNTVKYLIGICPQGVVSYISEGWGGRCSDKHITERCGLLSRLLPGDVILADRGFTIADQVGYHYATVKIPAFTKGKRQLDPKEVEDTRKIASVRIHVERVIGTIRNKFQILNGPLSIVMLKDQGKGAIIDEVVKVCCALNNMCQSVIPFE